MDYKKKYEEAERLYRTANADQRYVLESLFPELKESEDEKIKKEIISFIQDDIDKINLKVSGDYDDRDEDDIAHQNWCKKAIAWLENIPYTIDHEKREGFHLGYKAGLEKQAEQKPTDNVESKFKVGDWITDNEDEVIFHITSYDIDYGYQLETVNGTSFHYSDETIEKKYRLWTIQDAKDGDVLTNGDFPCIFKRCDDNGSLYVYCGINAHNDFSILYEDPENVWDDYSKQYFPAIKEQRDTFFAKMKESGYEWLEETKELKKIEQESAKWNEEDEHRVKDTIYFLETAKKHYASTVELGACIDWLKSLKPQNTWKPSDAQMQALKEACDKSWEPDGLDPLYTLYEQLKKLREE